ncbi:GNAT family N-acetyltransferase [uncultured Mediterranea sp.]|uniref:GNAT family N-acetyltransferase n=1 Tax=uncultured Mediterranea sp. TaxID=1926662 RepID=UPI0035A60E12
MIRPLSFNQFMNMHAPNKTTDITFRPATVTDIPELKELFCSTVLTVNVRDYTAEEVADWASCGNRLGHWEKLMATLHFIAACDAEGRIVGFTSIRKDGYLHSMFVHKDHQGEGIATALLQRIEAYAMEHGICDITSEVSITARPFFERRGYVVEQEQRAQANRLKLTNYIMKKQLKKI